MILNLPRNIDFYWQKVHQIDWAVVPVFGRWLTDHNQDLQKHHWVQYALRDHRRYQDHNGHKYVTVLHDIGYGYKQLFDYDDIDGQREWLLQRWDCQTLSGFELVSLTSEGECEPPYWRSVVKPDFDLEGEPVNNTQLQTVPGLQ